MPFLHIAVCRASSNNFDWPSIRTLKNIQQCLDYNCDKPIGSLSTKGAVFHVTIISSFAVLRDSSKLYYGHLL